MKKNLKIIYAEDNPMDRDLIRTFFDQETRGFELNLVERGEEVVASIRGQDWDAVLLDYQLPDMDGIEVVRRIRAENKELPIILLTGFGDEELIVQARKMGVDHYLPKRADYLQELPGLLERVISEKATGTLPGNRHNYRPYHILYVEDAVQDVDLLISFLRDSARHISVTAVNDRSDAITTLARDDAFDLVLCDLRLPDGTAIDLLNDMKENGTGLPVVILTGKGNEQLALESLRNGAYDYLVKKGNYLAQLPHVVENAIRRHQHRLSEERMVAQMAAELDAINRRKDQFLSLIAHDIKSPFNAILGFLSILIRDFDHLDDAVKMNHLRTVDRSVKKVYELLENLLDWAITQTGGMKMEPKRFKPKDLCRKVFEVFALSAQQKSISFRCEVADDPEVFADENMVYTALRNLVSNAIKFSLAGGEVTIRSDRRPGFVEISVTDRGMGIPQEQAENLFRVEKVLSTPGTAGEKGTGFGLLLTKELIEQNGGEITFSSTPGVETRFSFILPAMENRL